MTVDRYSGRGTSSSDKQVMRVPSREGDIHVRLWYSTEGGMRGCATQAGGEAVVAPLREEYVHVWLCDYLGGEGHSKQAGRRGGYH